MINIKPGILIGGSALIFSYWILKKKNPNEDILINAKKFYKLQEIPDTPSNPLIDKMFREFGYQSFCDDIAWCSLFVNYILKLSGYKYNGKLNARSFLEYPGATLNFKQLKPGDIVILWRGSPGGYFGHVAFFIKQDKTNLYLLGGNQCDEVNIYSFDKKFYLGGKRPIKAV